MNGLGSAPRTRACFSGEKVLLGCFPSSKVGSEPDSQAVLLFGLTLQPVSGSSGTAMSNLIMCQCSRSTIKLQKTDSSYGTQRHDYEHFNTSYSEPRREGEKRFKKGRKKKNKKKHECACQHTLSTITATVSIFLLHFTGPILVTFFLFLVLVSIKGTFTLMNTFK